MLDKYIDDLKKGDNEALEDIYNETRKLIYSICLSYMHDKMLAEDMMQETYVNVFQYAKKYKSKTNPLAWIIKICRNRCLNELKKKKRISLKELLILLMRLINLQSKPMLVFISR